MNVRITGKIATGQLASLVTWMVRGLLAYYETYDYCIELASGVLSSGGELVNRARNEAKNNS